MNIVFDFGAVMVDWQPAKVVAKHFPLLAHDTASAQVLGKRIFTHKNWQAFDQGLLPPDEVAQSIATDLSLPQAAMHAMVHCIADHLQPIDSSVALLRELNTHRDAYAIQSLTFLSNMPELYARALERTHRWVHDFDSGIFSGDVKLIKPSAAIYELVEQRLGASGSSILFIDDHADNIAVAQQRGWQTIHLVDSAQLPALLHQALHLPS